jgi:NAD(P)H-hydrate epimerase
MRSGAGLVTLGLPSSLVNAVVKLKTPEVMLEPLAQTSQLTLSLKAYPRIKGLLMNKDVLIIGPGLTQNRSTQNLVRRVIKDIDKSVVIDADGLNALCGNLGLLIKNKKRRQIILTPHPGEMSRLIGKSIKAVQADRQGIARKLARQYKITVALKGQHTIVVDYQGNLYINKTGNPGMATAGSGDVLSGMIGAFLGQGLTDFQAAKYAVFLHGLAGDLAAEEKTGIGLIASDIIEKIPEAVKRCS